MRLRMICTRCKTRSVIQGYCLSCGHDNKRKKARTNCGRALKLNPEEVLADYRSIGHHRAARKWALSDGCLYKVPGIQKYRAIKLLEKLPEEEVRDIIIAFGGKIV